MPRKLSWIVALVSIAAACGGAPKPKPEPEPEPEPAPAGPAAAPVETAKPETPAPAEPTFAEHAADNYKLGMSALEAERWVLAQKYFLHIQERYPYSKYGVLAELRQADAALGAGDWRSAFQGYTRFMKLHPTHEMTENGYASLMTAEIQLRVLQVDPPEKASEREAAWRELDRFYNAFIARYSSSPYLAQAKERLEVARAHVAELDAN